MPPEGGFVRNILSIPMDVQVVQLDRLRIVMLRHVGPYEGLASAFDRLFEWVEANDVPVQRTIGIYYDNPEFVPADRLKSAACAEIPIDYIMRNRGGLDIELGDIAAGPYAVTRYVGPYENMEPAWAEFTKHIEGRLMREISDKPAFEVYVNDVSDTPPAQLITELYMPLV
ncbi:hypothetical protein EON79_14205 [bacterium]|nr:MAG: hypothetical protein EON79_14205 [bacterium]